MIMKTMENTLKRIVPFMACCFLLATFNSCEKHDFFDEHLITGEVGPQAYWEVGSSTVRAGSNVSFVAQYYSTVSKIDYSEVWYSVSEKLTKSVSCPWLTSFSYSYTSETIEEKRISQKVAEYPHSQTVLSDSLRAYVFEDEFPLSGTLSVFSWRKPEQFDSARMNTYFGDGFMEHFKDSLYDLMQFADFQRMLLGMGLLEDFKIYTDSTEDVNTGGYVYHFPEDAEGNRPVPSEIKAIYDGITFDKLIENTSESNYEVEFRRSYAIDAIMRVYDVRGVYGTTISKAIEIN